LLEELQEMDAADLAGNTIIVDARLGGLSVEGLLDSSEAAPPRTLDGTAEGTPFWDETQLMAIGRRLRIVGQESEPLEGWVREAGWPITLDDIDEVPAEWRVERVIRAVTEGDAARLRKAQPLYEHLEWTAEAADRIACALGLSDDFRRMLGVAARQHDSGKGRELWQTAMGAPRAGRPFAKTDGRRADARALGGCRHEFGSLRDAEAELSEIADERLRDLARHLIVSHHGWGRPTIPPIDPADPPSLAAERSQATALRFARLQREWGPWGLAWWESLLRAADWAASSRSAEPGATGEKT
jgi:CRISPR-associated endonuclease/helicase Cas3